MAQKASSSIGRLFIVAGKSSKVIKAFKAAKVVKPLISLGSMGVSVFAYSFSMGLVFAVGFVLLLLFHECGHALALRHRGFKSSLPVFIPMVGAAVFAPSMGKRNDEAYMAFAGPLAGLVLASLLFVSENVWPHPPALLAPLVYTGIVINLFNLIPIRPLDGGRVAQAIGPGFKYIGAAALFGLTLYLKQPGILFIWILVLTDFTWLRGYCRLGVGLIIEAMMITMMVVPIGLSQPHWENVMDVVLASFMNLAYLIGHKAKVEEETDKRPHLLPRERRTWLLLYGGLTVALFVMLIYSRSYLPPAVVA